MVNINYNRETLFKLIKLGKPQFVFAIFIYFLIGALLAVLLGAQFVLNKFIFGYAILFMASMAIHYANDYFDFETDHYGTPTTFTGGSGILVKNPELKELSKKIAVTFICLSIVIAVFFTFIYSYPLVFFLFVIFGNFLIWFYAAPPVKLSYRGMGEVSNTLNGLILPAMGYFVVMGTLDIRLFIFTIPLLFLQLLFTSGVEIPDLEGDRLGGKITWIVLRGRKFGFKLIGISGFLATLSFLLIPFTNLFPPSINFRVLAVISLLPLSLAIVGLIKRPVDKEPATKLATLNVASFIVMLILIDVYFLYVLK
jgi:1,4-dihydroxy-2-naphthoate octaprenyltransferase